MFVKPLLQFFFFFSSIFLWTVSHLFMIVYTVINSCAWTVCLVIENNNNNMHLLRIKVKSSSQHGQTNLTDQTESITTTNGTSRNTNIPGREQRYNGTIWQLLPFINTVSNYYLSESLLNASVGCPTTCIIRVISDQWMNQNDTRMQDWVVCM